LVPAAPTASFCRKLSSLLKLFGGIQSGNGKVVFIHGGREVLRLNDVDSLRSILAQDFRDLAGMFVPAKWRYSRGMGAS
jgi:hypothetical protein